jgi:hypothetical protein
MFTSGIGVGIGSILIGIESMSNEHIPIIDCWLSVSSTGLSIIGAGVRGGAGTSMKSFWSFSSSSVLLEFQFLLGFQGIFNGK